MPRIRAETSGWSPALVSHRRGMSIIRIGPASGHEMTVDGTLDVVDVDNFVMTQTTRRMHIRDITGIFADKRARDR